MSGHFFNFSDKEVMTPQMKEVNGIFYRIHPIVEIGTIEKPANTQSSKSDALPLSDLIADFTPEEQDVLFQRVRKAPGSETFRLLLDTESIPPVLFPMIIGKGGLMKKAMEDETKARIIFPERGPQHQNKPIEIYSYDEVQLLILRRRLLESVQSARFRTQFTHFLCFPTAMPVIQKSFTRFQEEVTKKCGGSRGFSTDLFQTPYKLHITIGTLAMFSSHEYNLAANGLEECFMEGLWHELEEGPLVCRLKGLEMMNDDPSEVDVLYAKIEDKTGRMQKIADRVYEWFMESEPRLLQDKFDHLENVKLHVTLMNSRFRKGEELGEEDAELMGGAKATRQKTFDASDILKKFCDFDFGEIDVKEIHISQRFSSGSDGFYKATRKLALDPQIFRGREVQIPAKEEEFVQASYSDEPSCDVEDEFLEQK